MRDMLGACLKEAFDIATRREMLAFARDHDDAHAIIGIESLEDKAQLIACAHRDDVVGRSREDDVGAFIARIELHVEAVEFSEARIGEGKGFGHVSVFHVSFFPWIHAGVVSVGSASYSPATSRRRRSFPTGDFGISRTKT